jgi:hypothetical protein
VEENQQFSAAPPFERYDSLVRAAPGILSSMIMLQTQRHSSQMKAFGGSPGEWSNLKASEPLRQNEHTGAFDADVPCAPAWLGWGAGTSRIALTKTRTH